MDDHSIASVYISLSSCEIRLEECVRQLTVEDVNSSSITAGIFVRNHAIAVRVQNRAPDQVDDIATEGIL